MERVPLLVEYGPGDVRPYGTVPVEPAPWEADVEEAAV
jgi:hypothetical protein